MTTGWIRTLDDASSKGLHRVLDIVRYEDLLDDEIDVTTFDLGSIPRGLDSEHDLVVLTVLLRAELRGGVLYLGTPRRNLVVPGIEIMDRASLGILRFVASTGVALIG